MTAISDEGLHSANPVQDLSRELVRLAHRVGLDPNHLRYDVRGQQDGPYGYQKTKLQLPPQLEIPDFVEARILPFLEDIRDNSIAQRQITATADNISFTIIYDVSQPFMSGRYPAYDVALSPKKNPLWNQLVNKARQIDGAVSIAPIGIIACNAGCSLFYRTGAFGTFTAIDVLRQFFREHTEVSFVLLLTVKDVEPFACQKRTLRIEAEFYSAGEGSKTLRLRNTLTDAVAKLPNPVLDPLNAYFQCR